MNLSSFNTFEKSIFNYFLIFSLFISFLASAQSTQKEVVAVSGDGVYSVLIKNGMDPIKYYKAFIELNKENLSSDNNLFIGKTYILPKNTDIKIDSIPSFKKVEYQIFGKDNASVIIKDNKLKGTVYYLISGHGGPDPGATEIHNNTLISEDEYAYDVTLRLAKILISRGAEVYIIIKDNNDGIRNKQILQIDYDEVNYPDEKISRSQKQRLEQRTKAVNNLYLKNKGKYQRLIVTHIDSRNEGENIDVFFYHHKNSKNGKQLAEQIHNAFKQKYAEHQPNRTYSGTVGTRGLYLIKNTLPAMVYIELGNIKNKKDQKRILNYRNREALAEWIYTGILDDYKLSTAK